MLARILWASLWPKTMPTIWSDWHYNMWKRSPIQVGFIQSLQSCFWEMILLYSSSSCSFLLKYICFGLLWLLFFKIDFAIYGDFTNVYAFSIVISLAFSSRQQYPDNNNNNNNMNTSSNKRYLWTTWCYCRLLSMVWCSLIG